MPSWSGGREGITRNPPGNLGRSLRNVLQVGTSILNFSARSSNGPFFLSIGIQANARDDQADGVDDGHKVITKWVLPKL
jgi:hypothetical protein